MRNGGRAGGGFSSWLLRRGSSLDAARKIALGASAALMPAIVFAATFRAIDAFRTFDLVFGLTNGGPVQATTTLSYEAFQNGFEFQRYGYASAISYVMVIAAVIGITLLFRVVKVRRLEVTT